MAPIFTGVTRGLGGFGFGKGPSGPTVFGATGGNIDAATPGNGYTYHVFTSPGTLTLTGPPGPVEYLVLGGGGAGAYDRNGGGGAGGLRCNSPGCPSPRRTPSLTLTTGGHTITVGDGGSTTTGYSPWGNIGSNSSIGTQVVATGGGSAGDTLPGGSGFGGGSQGENPYGTTVASPDGLSPTVQGYDGGNGPGSPPATTARSSGGGGGAGGAGQGGGTNSQKAGNGGSSFSISDFAGPLFPTMPPAWQSAVGPTGAYGGGGGGGGDQDLGGASDGGTGGGAGAGNGGTGPGADGTAAVANTGSGGGGGSNIPQGDGGAGGSGIVIIRYE